MINLAENRTFEMLDTATVNTTTDTFWTHPSVQLFCNSRDPIAAMIERANILVLDTIEQGWKGPPFDIFELANLLGFPVIPCESIRDARLIPIARNRFRIEYNPNQPQARIRFSIAHEIAHTLFPDCRDQVRNRAARHHMVGEDWQLEMLCNIGAAELLMPMGSFPEIGETEFSIDLLLRLRERFQVSTEAVLLRFLKLSRIPCAVFAASRQFTKSDYASIDYLRSTNDWNISIRSGYDLSPESVVNECQAIGYTAKSDESWDESIGEMHIECVTIPSYPGAENPRVVGLLSPSKPQKMTTPTIGYLVGDATNPRGEGKKIIAHVVNDATPRWGGGFARVVGQRWREVQHDFVDWAEEDKSRLRLGNHCLFRVDDDLSLFHMISQHGYRPTEKPSIRYRALETCLYRLSAIAEEQSATVHMPRIGCGQAGGNWPVVAELIDDILCRHGIEVTIYDLTSERSRWEKSERQPTLFDNNDAE